MKRLTILAALLFQTSTPPCVPSAVVNVQSAINAALGISCALTPTPQGRRVVCIGLAVRAESGANRESRASGADGLPERGSAGRLSRLPDRRADPCIHSYRSWRLPNGPGDLLVCAVTPHRRAATAKTTSGGCARGKRRNGKTRTSASWRECGIRTGDRSPHRDGCKRKKYFLGALPSPRRIPLPRLRVLRRAETAYRLSGDRSKPSSRIGSRSSIDLR